MPNCKYLKQQEIVSYNGGVDWQDVMPAQYRKGQLIEHDSEDCGELDTIYRWRKLTGVYMCVDDVKYEKLILDESYDGGLSWYPAYPSQYTTGEEIGVDEDYCNDKFVGHYILTNDEQYHPRCPSQYRWNGFKCVYVDPIKVVKCDGNPELTSTDTRYYSSYPSNYKFSLVSAEIEKCVASIGDSAFANNGDLEYVSMAGSVTSIDAHAFSNCRSLSGMNTTIPGELNIPSGITSIGEGAFGYCSGITKIICNAVTPPTLGAAAFYTHNDCPIYVPCGSFWEYMDSWSNLDYRLNPIGGESCIPMRARYDYNGGFRTYYCRGTDTIVDSSDTDGTGVERSEITGVTIGSCATAIAARTFTGCTSLTSITIPSGVTSIGEFAFEGCSGLTSIDIPNSVTSIGNNAFSRCTSLPVEGYIRYADTYAIGATDNSLTSYTLKNNTRWIAPGAFFGCSGLTSITIPDSVTSIGGHAFNGCGAMVSCTMSDHIISIGEFAFAGCSGLTSIDIPNSVTSIGARAFSNCSKLGSISVPNGITSIEEYTFYNCARLTSCTIGSGVTSIGKAAFMDCSGLTSIDIPDSAINVGDSAFAYCSGLTSVTIGNSVTTIGNDAFRWCRRLTSVTMQNSVTRIGYEAFQGCTSLRSVTIPNSVTTIGYDAFDNCSGLQSVTVLATTPPTLGLGAFVSTPIASGTGTIYVPASSVEAYKAATNWRGYASRIQPIPTKWIATYSDSSLTSAECDSTSKIVQNEINTTNLVSLEIGDCVTSIGEYTFEYCYGLTSCTIGSGVTTIGYGAFMYCTSLTSIDIPNSVTSIGNNAFRSCIGLRSVTVEATTPPSLGGTSVFTATNNCPIYVPASSVNAYKTATKWSDYADRIQPIT